MRNIVFDEIKAKRITAGHVWRFQQYHGAFAVYMNELERREFYNTIAELCNEGVFKAEPYGTVQNYRLTEVGEKIIYSL
mgnify:CR=1 FL=1